MKNEHKVSEQPSRIVRWENGPLQHNRREYRRKIAGTVRTILHRQNRRFIQLQEEYNKQKQLLQQPNKWEFMENESIARLTMDVPGVNKQDIQIQLDLPHHELLITAKRSYIAIDGRSCTAIRTKCRRFTFKSDVFDVTRISANLHCGVLTMTLPKRTMDLVDSSKWVNTAVRNNNSIEGGNNSIELSDAKENET